MSSLTLDLIQKGAKQITVWGAADYTDIFGKSRHLDVRGIGKELSGRGWVVHPTRAGNAAT